MSQYYGTLVTQNNFEGFSGSLSDILEDIGRQDENGYFILSAKITTIGSSNALRILLINSKDEVSCEYLVKPVDGVTGEIEDNEGDVVVHPTKETLPRISIIDLGIVGAFHALTKLHPGTQIQLELSPEHISYPNAKNALPWLLQDIDLNEYPVEDFLAMLDEVISYRPLFMTTIHWISREHERTTLVKAYKKIKEAVKNDNL